MNETSRFGSAVGRTIAALRAERGWTLREMSQLSGLSIAYLSELEHGRKEPSGATLEQLGDAFGLGLDGLLRIIGATLTGRPPVEPGIPPDLHAAILALDPPEIEELCRFAEFLHWRRTVGTAERDH